MKLFKTASIIIIFLAITVSFTFVMLFHTDGTNVKFQSSDMNWANSEMLYKAKGLNAIVFHFHFYKLKCDKPDVSLQRITPKPSWYQWEYWFNDYDDLKWQIPLGKVNHKTKTGYYPNSGDKEHCFNKVTSQEILEQVQVEYQQYLDQLAKNT